MHSCEPLPALGAPLGTAAASGPVLLRQLGRLIVRARSPAARRTAKLRAAHPSTSQVAPQSNVESPEPQSAVEEQLESHVSALWNEQIPVCIEVLLAPECAQCRAALEGGELAYESRPAPPLLLLERWTMRALLIKGHEAPGFSTSQWLLNAVRSQLHFSQLAAWRATLQHAPAQAQHDPNERRRKLSRETCNFKKLEANCDEEEQPGEERKLNVIYSIKIPGESYKMTEFSRTPTDHRFPVTSIGGNMFLKVVLESLPRTDEIPTVKCTCQPKRRVSKETPPTAHEDLVGKLGDLSLGPRCAKYPDLAINSTIACAGRRGSVISNISNTAPAGYVYTSNSDTDKCNIVDDRMLTPCSENGKHKCNCDEESDGNHRSSISVSPQETKKLDERRLKEIAKYKRRLRKESKLKKLCDSTSSEGEPKTTHTSIPILQAARFDRFRAIGCYRNQTYLTLPATRIESKSPFIETECLPPAEIRKSNTISTQTDIACQCGAVLMMQCISCDRGMVTSQDTSDRGRANGSCERSIVNSEGSRDRGMVRSEGNCDRNMVKSEGSCDRGMVKSEENCDRSIAMSEVNCDRSKVRPESNCDRSIVRPEGNCDRSVVGLEVNCDRGMVQSEGSSDRGMVRSEGSYDLVEADKEIGARRKREEEEKALKKHKCDNPSSNLTCDIDSVVNGSISISDKSGDESIIKRPKLRRFFPIVDRIEKIVADRTQRGRGGQGGQGTEHREKDIEELNLRDDDTVFSVPKPEAKRQKTYSVDEDYVLYENCDYGSFDRCDAESPKETSDREGFEFPEPRSEHQVPSPTEVERFRWRFDSAASMVFHSKTGLPLTSSPAPLRRGNNCFDFDDSINGVSGIKSALFHPVPAGEAGEAAGCEAVSPRTPTPPPRKPDRPRLRLGTSTGLLGSFEESALKGRLEPVATVHGFTAELGASGAFCPPHRRLPVTVFFYAPGGTNAPYMGHINLGAGGYRVPRAGTVQVSLFNPHGTLVKMFVVLYELSRMPARARTFLRQRTLYVPAAAPRAPPQDHHKWLRYLIHLRFMTSKSGKLYLHTDIRIIVSRKADLDTATAHSALFRPLASAREGEADQRRDKPEPDRAPNRVFGGCSDYAEIGYENSPGVPYELRSFTYAPDNPKYSPR